MRVTVAVLPATYCTAPMVTMDVLVPDKSCPVIPGCNRAHKVPVVILDSAVVPMFTVNTVEDTWVTLYVVMNDVAADGGLMMTGAPTRLRSTAGSSAGKGYKEDK